LGVRNQVFFLAEQGKFSMPNYKATHSPYACEINSCFDVQEGKRGWKICATTGMTEANCFIFVEWELSKATSTICEQMS